MPRFTEVLVNLVLPSWFRVYDFSASLVERGEIRDYVVGSKGSGFAANAFLTKLWPSAELKRYSSGS